MFRILFFEPRIPGNTGNAIRVAAATGAELHLVEPLGFDLSDSHLKRAGLDYHDLAVVKIHANLEKAWESLLPARVYAFSSHATTTYTDIAFQAGDVLMFGPEPTGLPPDVMEDRHISEHLRLPMLPGRRSMNLSNCASIAVFEAWRQLGFASCQQL